ncbi:hypothetical protein PFICI_01491 [Pestalotiopsis fici W106-1]|uniref:Transcription factor domain-containing protein n=1 Tax=Pestalotiopsis fici (strain W106-1 / CGMCC3.15140) TaxID=1229662 RepID=W3XNN1_PESFW|nr:uncharacterized protein PFICI_01491 [Pestalotiopsis fici W106-1]ETS87663.1 hypothetical protein PFICI_01491 [Pestalotiopsis fici W106-1]
MVLAEVDAVPGAEIVPSSLSSSASPHGFSLDSPMIGTVDGLSDYSLVETQDMTKSILTTTTNINPDMVTFATPLSAFLSLEPTLLYCPSPWPDDLQASPKRQFLWNYFLHSLQMNALCLDLEDMPDFQDPFIATIPQMALRNATLREAALCFSAFQYTALHGHWDLNRTMGAAWRKAYEGLRAQLAIRQAADGWSFLSMISACCLLYWCAADQGEDCLRLATKLAMEFLQQQQVEPTIPRTYQDVILTGFRWTMIATLCSLKPPSRLLNDKMIDAVEMGHHEVDANHSPAFANWISHPLYAFSPRLVNPLLRMGHLADMQLLRHKDKIHGSNDSTTDQFEHELLAVEETLLRAREADLMATIAPGCFTNPSSVASLNEAMHAASFILFYTRFRGLPFTAPVIRRQVRTVVSEISKIHEDSRVSYAIVFPLFIAACEAVDQEDRRIIENRLRVPRGLFVDRGNTTAALRHIWEIRDLQPSLLWPDWVSKGMNILVSAH